MPTISEYLFEVLLAKARITNNFRIAIIRSILIKFFNYLRKLKVTLTKIAHQKHLNYACNKIGQLFQTQFATALA